MTCSRAGVGGAFGLHVPPKRKESMLRPTLVSQLSRGFSRRGGCSDDKKQQRERQREDEFGGQPMWLGGHGSAHGVVHGQYACTFSRVCSRSGCEVRDKRGETRGRSTQGRNVVHKQPPHDHHRRSRCARMRVFTPLMPLTLATNNHSTDITPTEEVQGVGPKIPAEEAARTTPHTRTHHTPTVSSALGQPYP